MANLDLRGFNSGDVDFSGLYKVGDDLRYNKQLQERKDERLQEQKDKDEATLASNAKFLQNTFDPKQHLTGSLYDPVTTQLMSKAYGQALQLAQQKVPLDQILMATQPLVNKINDYTQKATMYTANKKEFLDQMKGVKGYDAKALSDEMDKAAFYDQDPATGQLTLNVDKADPTNNYGLDVIKNSPDKVTNSSGLEDMVKTYKPSTFIDRVKRTNAKGGYEMRKTKVVAPAWTTIDDNGDVVPKFQIAKDGDNVITHPFVDDKGNVKNEPVRLLDNATFHSLLSSDEGMATADWLKGELKKAGVSTDLNSTQANHAARAILYTELKNRTPIQYDDIEDTKANPIPRINVNVNNGNQPQKVIDLYNGDENNVGLKQIVFGDKAKGFEYTRFSKAPISVQTTLMKIARDQTDDKSLSNKNVYFKPNEDGDVELMQIVGDSPNSKKDISIFTVDPITLNTPVNTNVTKVGTGKSKVGAINEVIGTGSNQQNQQPQSRKGKDGKVYTSTDGITWKSKDGTIVTLKK